MQVLSAHQNETEKPDKRKTFSLLKVFSSSNSQMQILQPSLVIIELSIKSNLTPLEDTLSSSNRWIHPIPLNFTH